MRRQLRQWFGYLSQTSCLRFFVKECLFSLACAVGQPIQLDLATINKTKPSCARVKVWVDLKGNFPKSIMVDIFNENNGEMRTEVVHIQYNYVPTYFMIVRCNGMIRMNEERLVNRRR